MDPLTGALIIFGSQLLGNLFNWFASSQAEGKATKAAERERALAQDLLSQFKGGPNAAIKNQVKAAADLLGGRIAAAGLTGSDIANKAYADVAARAVSQITPAWWQAMMGATRLAMTPEEQLMQFYGGAAKQAAGSMGFDLSWLPFLNWGSGSAATGGGGGGTMKLW